MTKMKYVGVKQDGETALARFTGVERWMPGDVHDITNPAAVAKMLNHPDVFALVDAVAQVKPVASPHPVPAAAPASVAAPAAAPTVDPTTLSLAPGAAVASAPVSAAPSPASAPAVVKKAKGK